MTVRIRDVAALAGVSLGTVSNVVNRRGRPSDDIVRRVTSAIAELGYVPNDAARSLRMGRSRTIGLVLTTLENPFFTSLALGAERAAAEAGYGLLLGSSADASTQESRFLDLFEMQRVDGVLVTPPGPFSSRVDRLKARGTRIVLVDRRDEDDAHCSVSADDVLGGRLVGEHLLAMGRRRVIFAGAPVQLTQMADRLDGARAALREGGGDIVDVLRTDQLDLEAGQRFGHEILALPSRPEAVFAANDLVALGILQVLVRGGVRVPTDIALVGYDDIPFASAATVPVTTVRQSSELIGYRAAQLLIAELEAGDDHVHVHASITPELVVRESTAAEACRNRVDLRFCGD